MKKVLTLIGVLLICTSSFAAEQIQNAQHVQNHNRAEAFAKRAQAFEQRLGLTDEQKQEAKVLRQQGHEKLKPLMEEIFAKKQEVAAIKRSRMAVQMQEEKLSVLDEELKTLEKKAAEIRRANMKEFESILTRKQRKILKEMKQEGRQKYQQEH